MKDYGYELKEFKEIMDDGMLPRQDPKWALAKATFDKPIDINQSSYEELIRIPGIGPKTAQNITHHNKKIKKYQELRNLGVILSRAKPFIEVDGKRQKMLMEFA
jgi:predicted DNA-binding helix-hairpin-helix protein